MPESKFASHQSLKLSTFFFQVDDIPGPEALKFPGKRDGMTKMIREGNTISIHSWSQGIAK